MTVATTYAVRLDSLVQELNPPFIPRAVRITNYSGDNLAFDNSVDPVLLIPPGVVVPINIDHLVSTLRIRSASNTTGRATIQVLDSQLDVSNAPNLQQLPGTITAAIPSTVTVGGNVTSNDPTLATLITALNALVTTMQTDTSTLRGILPASAPNQFSLAAPGGLFSFAVTVHPVTGFSLALQPIGSGLVDVYVIANGLTTYKARQCPFSGDVNGTDAIIWRFDEPVPLNGSINVRASNWQQFGSLSGVLRA